MVTARGFKHKNLNVYGRDKSRYDRAYFFYGDFVAKRNVVFVHGTGNDALFQTYDLFFRLLESGYNVASFDLDGHGAVGQSYFDSETILASTIEKIEQLLGQSLDDSCTIIGNSLGGCLVSQALADGFLKNVDSVVLVAVPFCVKISPLLAAKELASLVYADLWSQISRWSAKDLLPAIGRFNRRKFPIRFSEQKSDLKYIEIVSKIIEKYPVHKSMERHELKTLAVYGDEDLLAYPHRDIDDLPNVRQRFVNSNHFMMLYQPSTIDLILDFLEA